jgi:glycosyltransferase involved in cell wall biosynthesis
MLAREFGPVADKAHVVRPGIDSIFKPTQDAAETRRVLERFGLEQPPLLFVGNVEPKKNIPALLDALARVKRRAGTRRKLLMVGAHQWRSGSLTARIARLGLAGDVVLGGYVPRADLPGIYRSSLALVFPSLWEGFGLPPLEAMACGCPVICTFGSGLSEGAGKAARLVPPDDVAALADAMEEVERSPDIRRWLREVGLRRVRNFRWPDRVREFPRLYELAAARRTV